jgi:hypothetical protein
MFTNVGGSMSSTNYLNIFDNSGGSPQWEKTTAKDGSRQAQFKGEERRLGFLPFFSATSGIRPRKPHGPLVADGPTLVKGRLFPADVMSP